MEDVNISIEAERIELASFLTNKFSNQITELHNQEHGSDGFVCFLSCGS